MSSFKGYLSFHPLLPPSLSFALLLLFFVLFSTPSNTLPQIGAFKFRGACNAVYQLDEQAAAKGVVRPSLSSPPPSIFFLPLFYSFSPFPPPFFFFDLFIHLVIYFNRSRTAAGITHKRCRSLRACAASLRTSSCLRLLLKVPTKQNIKQKKENKRKKKNKRKKTKEGKEEEERRKVT